MSTRHQDNLHHWSDLLGGAILGSLVAIIVYHFFYPPVTSFYSNKPYRYRINQILSDESHPINDSESVVSIIYLFIYILIFHFYVFF